MAIKTIVLRAILAAGPLLTAACAPKASADPPPQLPTSAVSSSADAALPNVPLSGKGVITPSDVKLQPPPKAAGDPPTGVTPVTVSPTAN